MTSSVPRYDVRIGGQLLRALTRAQIQARMTHWNGLSVEVAPAGGTSFVGLAAFLATPGLLSNAFNQNAADPAAGVPS